MQVGYDKQRGAFRDCRFCKGRGCLACPGEAERAYKKQFPDGPQPIATVKIEDIGKLKDILGPEAIEAAKEEGRKRVDDALLVSAIFKAIPCASPTEVMKGQAASAMVGEILVENIRIAAASEYPPIAYNRRCCMPSDRDALIIGNIRIMYCRVCRLIISKQDISNDPPTNVLFAIGERLEGK